MAGGLLLPGKLETTHKNQPEKCCNALNGENESLQAQGRLAVVSACLVTGECHIASNGSWDTGLVTQIS